MKQNTASVETQPQVTEAQKKAYNKNWLSILGNFILAAISVYLFEFWFDKVIGLSIPYMAGNFTMIGLLSLLFFVAKTAYTRGSLNTFKMWVYLGSLGVAIVAVMLTMVYFKQQGSFAIYPLSGLIIVGIAFYMLSLSSGTIQPLGIVFMFVIFAFCIGLLKILKGIEWSTVRELSQLGVFIILFVGGTWAQLRMALHGVRGVNKDGGYGDTNDGNGDNEGED